MWEGLIQSKSKICLVSCFCFLMGITTASFIEKPVDLIWLFTAIFSFIGFFILFWKNTVVRLFIFFLFCFFFGICRYSLAWPQADDAHITSLHTQKKEFIGVVSEEPDIRLDGVRYVVSVKKESKTGKSLAGTVYIKSDLYPRYTYGDELRVSCGLEKPEPVEEFRYDMYLANMGVFTVCQTPYIEKIGSKKGNPLLQGIFSFKSLIAKKIELLWHEPYASFMAGLLYGYRGGLGSLQELFATTGVTHIIAISGYNITLIATLLISCCTALSIPRKKAFVLVVATIGVFVIFAGASASVVRAGIMGIIVLFATRMGRKSSVAPVMMVTAACMALANPFVVVWDAGFQLSFLATLGLVYLSPHIEKKFVRVPNLLGLKETLIATCSAILATLPLILYQFGRLSVVAPVVNILILWALPWIMMLGFFAVVCSFIFLPFGNIIAWLAFAGMKYIVVVVTWFAHLRFASVDMHIPWWMMCLGYISMIGYVWKKSRVRGDAL